MTRSSASQGPTRRRFEWLLIGNYGADNTGDEAMLAGLLEGLAAGPDHHACVVSKTGLRPPWAAESRARWIPPRRSVVIRQLLVSDGLALGGGTHFHDDYRPLRLVRHWRYLLRIVVLTVLARLLGKRVLWLGVGVGPLDGRVGRLLARTALHACHRVTVRDRGSLEQVIALVPTVAAQEAFDLAALLTPPCAERGYHARRLGVSVTTIANARHGPTGGDAQVCDDVAAALLLVLDGVPDLSIVLLTMRGGCREDDVAVTARVHAPLAARYPGRVEFVPYDASPHATFRHVAGCDYLVGARYHASMLAFLAGVPQLVLAYHRKCADFCSHVGLPSEARIDLHEMGDPAAVRDRIVALIEHPERFAPRLSPGEARRAARLSLDAISAVSNTRTSGAACVVS